MPLKHGKLAFKAALNGECLFPRTGCFKSSRYREQRAKEGPPAAPLTWTPPASQSTGPPGHTLLIQAGWAARGDPQRGQGFGQEILVVG